MTKVNATAGAIISIPCDNSYVIAKILYVSKYFKNIALLKVYKHRLSVDKPFSDSFTKSSFELVYTGVDFIKKGRWKIIDSKPLSDTEEKLMKRVVGGDVWDADSCLGRASDTDLATLPSMRVVNVKAVEDKVAKYDSL